MAPFTFLRSLAQKKTQDVDVNIIIRSVLLHGTERVVSHEGASQYNRKGSGPATCGLVALNFVRVAFLKEQDGLRDEALLQAVLSRECTEETTAVCALWSRNLHLEHLEIEDICRSPVFQKTLKLKTTTYGQGHPGVHYFKSLLADLTIIGSSAAAIITRPPEILACLKLQLSTRSVFIIFDPHPRPSHPNGAGAIVSTSLEDTARRLTDLLPSADLQDGTLQWQSQHLAGHVFVPNIVDTSTTAMWQAVLESSLAQLSMQAEMRSQNNFQVSEQKRLVSELKEVEERCQRQERTIQELRSSASNTHSHLTANSQWPPPTSPPPPFSPSSNNPFLNSSFSGNTAASHSTSSRSVGPQDTHGSSPPPLFNWDDSLSYARRLQGEFDGEVRGLSAERNTFTRDTTEPHSNGSRPVGPHDTRGGPSTPLIDLDDSLTYARRLQSEFDSEVHALSAQRNTLTQDTTRPHFTGSRTAGLHDTRGGPSASAPLIDLDDSLSYARRLQSEFDSEERALSAERNALNRYATMSHSTSSRSAGSHDTRAGPSTPRFDWDDSLSYAERLQKEFDNEDRALSAERVDLSHTVQQVFQCGICMEEMPEDSVARPDPCGHSFCRECMRGYVSTRVEEHRFPILCPSCTASKGKDTGVTGEISQAHALNLGLTDEQLNIWTEMEMNSFSVLLHCRKCERSMFVARDEHEEETIIECPLPDCDHTWCKECQQTTELGGPQHSCDGTKELEHLMKEQGWKYCPSCKTPIQKVSGCNHMSCMTPACNTHFCYLCGRLIVKSALSREIDEATSSHFRSDCTLFEAPDDDDE